MAQTVITNPTKTTKDEIINDTIDIYDIIDLFNLWLFWLVLYSLFLGRATQAAVGRVGKIFQGFPRLISNQQTQTFIQISPNITAGRYVKSQIREGTNSKIKCFVPYDQGSEKINPNL